RRIARRAFHKLDTPVFRFAPAVAFAARLAEDALLAAPAGRGDGAGGHRPRPRAVSFERMSGRMSTETRFRVFPNLYKDSVALMQLGAALRERAGIAEASCVMATAANLAQLAQANLSIQSDARPSDLLVVVRGEARACDEALDAAETLLSQPRADANAGSTTF